MKWEYDSTLNHVSGLDNGNCMVLRAIPYGSSPTEVIANGYKIAAVNELYAVAEEILKTATIETPQQLIEMAQAALKKADNNTEV